MEDTIGIDISKDKLDAYWLSKQEHKQLYNNKDGVNALAIWAKGAGVSRVIFESTGIYHRSVEMGLAHHNISFARVNPRQARRFCEGAGQLAKTDRVDAAMLARMGSLLELKADEPKSETLHDLKQLATARQALIKDRTAAKARLAATTHRLLSQQIKRRLSQIERDLLQIAALVDTIIAADTELRAKAEILVSIPSITKVTACAILTDIPELGQWMRWNSALHDRRPVQKGGLTNRRASAASNICPFDILSGWPRQASNHRSAALATTTTTPSRKP